MLVRQRDCADQRITPAGVWGVGGARGRPLAINLEAAGQGQPRGPGIPSARRAAHRHS